MSAPTPSWYDLLGVEPDASADEIRAAWKAAIADLDPTDRRFTVLNQAAAILLDDEQRAEYDASLAPVTRQKLSDDTVRDGVTEATVSAGSPEAEAQADVEVATQPERASTTRRTVPAWLIAGLGLVAAALIGVCVWQAQEPTDDQVIEATNDAQAAAERAIVAIVSYDYRSLDDDQAKASAYMTDEFEEDYEALFAVIRENAPETKTILTTDVVASSIVRSGDDRVQVFMFINNPRTNAELTTPEVGRNQVTVTMQKVGDDWLVDDLKTTLPSS